MFGDGQGEAEEPEGLHSVRGDLWRALVILVVVALLDRITHTLTDSFILQPSL